MTVRTISLGLVYLVAVLAGAAVAVDWILTHVWSPAGTHTRLLFAPVAPLGVVLFALLVEQLGRVGEWLAPRAAEVSRRSPCSGRSGGSCGPSSGCC